ncbi:hypothetical protein ACIRBY_12590 [Streptomyces sp. NPDC096136]|uniref:hypothetical protein n=1 Tax=Streptomyces sp. NPDC096136 TaxID=3366076 RepID=UPI003828F740
MTRTRFLMAVATLSTVVAATLTAGQASADTLPVIVAGTTITDSSGPSTRLEDPILSDDVTWGH